MINTWWGLLPFAVLFISLLAFRRTLLYSCVLFLITTSVLALFIWLTFPIVAVGAALKGLLVGLDIVLIISGSLFFLDVQKRLRILSSLEHYLHKLSPDSRIQAILFAWFFGGLLEGATGFSAPPAIIAPLLVNLGFQPITAICIALIANTVPVAFGAVGTPIRVGFNGIAVNNISANIAPFGLVLSIVIPLVIAWFIKREVSNRQGRISDEHHRPSSIIPFAIWSGLAFGIPFYLTALVNPDVPSLVGGLVGLILTFLGSKQKWWRDLFLPKITQSLHNYDPNQLPLTLLHTTLPYFIMVLALLAARYTLPSFDLNLPGGIMHTFNLYNPGVILLILASIYAIHGKFTRIEYKHTATKIGHRIFRASITIMVIVAATQILIHSTSNYRMIPGMLDGFTRLLYRENVGIISPLIGMAGSFVAGSATISNLMFGQLQVDTAKLIGTSAFLMVFLQLFGATAGNSMALISITAAEGALGLKNQFRAIFLKMLAPLGMYLIAIILLGALAPIFGLI